MNNNIRKLRKEKGLSMQALADLAGTTQQQIDRLEKDKRKMTVDWINILCKALNCAPGDLVEFTAAKKTTSKVPTIKAKIIGALETKFSNMIRKFDADEQYEISFRSNSNDKNYFGLVVEGGSYGKYPEGSELIFSETSSKAKQAGAAEDSKNFIVSKNEKQHQFEIDGKLVQAELVKSIRNE